MSTNVTKILIRRGTDSQRKTIALNSGEPGYSIDTKRLFIGDGITLGGNPAGVVNYGIITALSGSYIFGSIQTGLSQQAFKTLSAANVGDIVYNQNTTSIWTISSTSVIGGTIVPILSDFAHLYSTTLFNTNQFYYNGSQLTIQNGQNGQGYGVGINEIDSSITAGSLTLSGGSGKVLGIKPGSILNSLIKAGTSNSVKITNSSGTVTDVTIGQGQILGQSNALNSALGAITLSASGGVTLNANAGSLTFSSPVGIPQSGGFITGALSALKVYSGRFVTDVTPGGPNDVVNYSFVSTLSTGLITPAFLTNNYYPLTGGILNGSIASTGSVVATNGLYSTNNYTGSYTDGIVIDYVTGNGRISVGPSDAITLYNGGPASTALLTLAAGGNVGIGTTGPTAKLNVYGGDILTQRSGGIDGAITFGAADMYIYGNTSADYLTFGVGNIERVRINPTGYVGIGTTTPASLLHVAAGALGTTINNTLELARFTDTDANTNIFKIYQNRFANGVDWTTAETRLQLVTDVTNQGYISYSPDGLGGLAFGTGSPSTESVRITNGNVGIGTTRPNALLTVNGQVSGSQFFANKAPTVVNELTRKDYVDAQITTSAPPGAVAFFATTTAPAGWIKANGAVLRQVDYPALFAALPKAANNQTIWWQANDGSTNFRIPDLRGQFIRGWNDGIAAANNGSNTLAIPTTDAGRGFGSNQGDTLQGHIHKSDSATSNLGIMTSKAGGGNYGSGTVGQITGVTTINTLGPISDGINGTPRTGLETRPTNISLLACIKY
jgi:Phage Tail Collar Domain/Major tropism determinant N-terminal domain